MARAKSTKSEGARIAPGSLRAVSYVRVSSDEQAEKYGPKVQRQEIARFAEREGIELAAEYQDLGVSGTTPLEQRSGLSAALEAIRTGEASFLVVARYDRLARDTLQALLIERAFAGNVLYAEGFNGEGGAVTFMREVMHAMASEQRRQLVSRLAAGRQRKASEGGFAEGRVPYGYRTVNGALVIDEEQAQHVRRMFDLAARGATPGEIARHLAGVPTPRGGAAWSRQAIHGLLANPTYTGERAGTRRAHPAIISRRRFNEVQRALAARARR